MYRRIVIKNVAFIIPSKKKIYIIMMGSINNTLTNIWFVLYWPDCYCY